MHRPLDHGIRRLGVHHVQDRVDDLVAADAEDGRAQDPVRLGVHQHLHEALRLALLHGAANARHRPRGDQGRAARFPDLLLGHADAGERRVDVERVAVDTVRDAARVAVQEVGGDDLVVVVGGVREGAAAVALAQRPHAGDGGLQPVVHGDDAAPVDLDAGGVQAQVVGVRAPSHRQQQVRSDHARFPGCAVQRGGDRVAVPAHVHALRVQAHVHALGFQDPGHRRGDVRRFPLDQAVAGVDERDLAAEAAVHLRELQPDVAAADDDQVLGQHLQVQDGRVGQVVHPVEPGERRHERARSHVDEDPLGLQQGVAHADPVSGLEAGVPLVDRAVGERPEPALDADLGRARDRVLARLHARHVDAHGAVDHDAEVGGPARHVRGAGAGHQRLGGDAAHVDAGAAEAVALDDGGVHAGAGERRGQAGAGLAGADDDGVVRAGQGRLRSSRGGRRPARRRAASPRPVRRTA